MTGEDRKVVVVCLWGAALLAVALALVGLGIAAALGQL